MKIILGTDHGGFKLKEEIKKWLADQKYEVEDVGANELDSDDDYVDYAALVGEELMDNSEERGILFCRNGFGMVIAANRFPGVRCGLAFDKTAVTKGRNDDDINCLSIPSDYMEVEKVKEMIKTFLETKYSDGERYSRRLQKLADLTACEDGCCGGECGGCC